MFRLARWLLWLVISIVIIGGADQALIRMPITVPVLSPLQNFYIDFRGRLFGLIATEQPQAPSIEQVIDTNSETASTPVSAQRYVYVDDSGTLQFADNLNAIPQAYRKNAQPMD
ncbi:MAG: hypothetical protein C0618_00590 [Desulfuromonas sp.]|nr:MAG: hypothetical protein C0618_00590 [Desulfuromonas sp.]